MGIMPVNAVDFLEKHLPARAFAWEIAALEAIAGGPSTLLPWPYLAMEIVEDPTLGNPSEMVRLTSDLGRLYLPARGRDVLRVKVCGDLAIVAMRIPEKESYSLIVEGFGVTGAMVPGVTDTQPVRRRAHDPLFPSTPAPGYMFADATAADWDAPLEAGDVLSIAFKNTSDAPVTVRVRGEALVLRTLSP